MLTGYTHQHHRRRPRTSQTPKLGVQISQKKQNRGTIQGAQEAEEEGSSVLLALQRPLCVCQKTTWCSTLQS